MRNRNKNRKDLIQYKFKILDAIYRYNDMQIEVDDLVKELQVIEIHAQVNIKNINDESSMWFRFGDSPLAIDIADIEKNCSGHCGTDSQNHYIELMQNVVNDCNLEIYLS